MGRTDASGNYSLRTYEDGDGAAAGDYTVLVTKQTVTSAGPVPHDPNARGAAGPASHSGGPGSVTAKSEIPEKYSGTAKSDLTATVTADGENTFNFDLKD